MLISHFSTPVTSRKLNEDAASRFGQQLDLDGFTLEQLYDARNHLRTKVSQIEETSDYNVVTTSRDLKKNKLFLDILNAEINGRQTIEEAFTDTEQMVLDHVDQGLIEFSDLPSSLQEKAERIAKRKFSKSMKKKPKIQGKPGSDLAESQIMEGEEEKAELIMNALEMVDRVTSWLEDTANMQAETLITIIDNVADEMGGQVSTQFADIVKPALEQMYASLDQAKQALSSAVGVLTGEEPVNQEPDSEFGMDTDRPDDFGASDAAIGGDEPAGRLTRESREVNARLIRTLSQKKR